MNNTIQNFKRIINQIKGLFPTSLPQGVEEFKAWSKSIAETYTLPTLDQDSVHFALASMIMSLGTRDQRKAKYFFVQSIRAAAAKQVASSAFMEIKQRQAAEAKAAQAKQAATPQESPNESKQ